MKDSEIIKSIMKEKGIPYAVLAEKLGYKTTSGFSEKLRRGNGMRTDGFAKILAAMDCEIIVRDRTGKKNQWKLTADSEDK